MRTLKRAALTAVLLGAPALVLAGPLTNSGSMPDSGVSSPGAGYSTGVTAGGWQQRTPRRRSVQAGGTAAAVVIVTAAAAATFRGRR